MSLKDFFNKNKSQATPTKPLVQKNINDFADLLESDNYVKEFEKKNQNYLLDVDYSDPKNFAKFGLARKYYENVVGRINDYFPYDGSKYEQLKFENELNPLEKYIYNFEYPKSTGYVIFSPDGWGTQSTTAQSYGLSNNQEYISFYNQSKNNVYDPNNNKRENTRFIFSSGSTIEFWLKKDGRPDKSSQTAKEAIFYTATTGSANKDKRVVVYVSGGVGKTGSIFTEYYTDTATKFAFEFNTGISDIADSNWHHYAFTYYSSSSGYNTDFYFDGIYKNTQTSSTTIENLTGSAFCVIGSLGGKVSGSSNLSGYGKLSGSIDEFRFWNITRNAQQIGLNYFKNVGGGANSDIANVNLGIYYKFNEGILENTAVDSVILDYSGHLCNGTFNGYSTTNRNTGSAITSATQNTEVGSPIIYYDNPNVQSFLSEKLSIADSHDYSNNFSLKNLLPTWIVDDDVQNGETLLNFTQVISSYLDTLYLQIEKSKDIKNKEYLQHSGSEAPFNDLLLTSAGFQTPNLFISLDELSSIASQNNQKEYTVLINELKSIVYKNIYNNLDVINKSKGTEKSFKNLIKCFGADDDLYKLNIYSNKTNYPLNGSYVNKSIKKDIIDQTNYRYNQNSNSVIYSYYDSSDSNTTSFITSSAVVTSAICFESNFYFPTKPTNIFETAVEKSNLKIYSLFGTRGASDTLSSVDNLSQDSASFSVRYCERDNKSYFQLYSAKHGIDLTSSYFQDFYNNNLWNISFQIYKEKTLSSPEFTVKFSGYSFINDNTFNSFELTSSLSQVSASAFFSSNKRVYVGAERTNITGTLLYPSNHRVASTMVWLDKLDSYELKEHSKNPNIFGRKNPAQNALIENNTYIPKSETLILLWDYSTVTSSNVSGNLFYVNDLTSGSMSAPYSSGYLSNFKSKIYSAAGYGFEPSVTIKQKEYIFGQEQQDPESVLSSNLVNILESNDDYYTKLDRPEKFFFAVETSMYDIISKSMLNFFGSIIEFNNLIADPLAEYRFEYKDLDFFRRIFFEKVQNTIDLERYVEVYKWIDDALDGILGNLIPASANVSEKARTVVENTILQRNKIKKQIYPKSFIYYVKDSGNNTGDQYLYVGKTDINNGAINKEGVKPIGALIKP